MPGFLDILQKGAEEVEEHNVVAGYGTSLLMHQDHLRHDGLGGKLIEGVETALDGKVLSDIFAGEANLPEKAYGVFAVMKESYKNAKGFSSLVAPFAAAATAISLIVKFDNDAEARAKAPGAPGATDHGETTVAKQEEPGFFSTFAHAFSGGPAG